MSKSLVSITVVLVFTLFQLSCTVTRIPVYSATKSEPIANIQLHPNQKYEFLLFNQFKPLVAKPGQLKIDGNIIVIDDSNSGNKKFITMDHVASIHQIDESKNKQRGKNTLKGLGYGTLAGILAGSAVGFGTSQFDFCNGYGCDDGEKDIVAGVSTGILTLLISSFAGMGIGAALPVKDKIAE